MGAAAPLSQVRDLKRQRDALVEQVRQLTELLTESRELLQESLVFVKAPEGSRWILLPERAAIDLAWICRTIRSSRQAIARGDGGTLGHQFGSVLDASLEQVIGAVERAFGVASRDE